MGDSLLKDRLKTALHDKGISALELARLSEVKPSFVYDILNGKSANPSTTKMARISSVLGTELSTLLDLHSTLPNLRSEKSEYVIITTLLTAKTTGNGQYRLEETEGDPYHFRRDWVLNRLNTQPENLRLVRVEGDSMDPTLCHGDTVLIDITRRTPSPPGVFVLFDGIGLVVKRLEYLPHSNPPSIRILSDNPQYHAMERPLAESQITGRVVWFAREL